jgi:hypothetical protein
MFHVSNHSKLHSKRRKMGSWEKNDYNEPNNIMLGRWVNKVLDQGLSKEKLDLGLKL